MPTVVPVHVPTMAEAESMRARFADYAKTLDERNDRQERVVKLDRDVRIESKRVIFALHRVPMAKTADERDEMLASAWTRLRALVDVNYTAMADQLRHIVAERVQRSFSPGLQEFIEAASFHHYLRDGHLMTQDEVAELLTFPAPVDAANSAGDATAGEGMTTISVPVGFGDYVCGVGDLAGELNRYALNAVAAGRARALDDVIAFLRRVYTALLLLHGMNTGVRDFAQKVHVWRQSLQKVEWSQYVMTVRAAEVPEHMLAQVIATTAEAPADAAQEAY